MKLERKIINVKLEDAEIKFSRVKANAHYQMLKSLAEAQEAESEQAKFKFVVANNEHQEAILETCIEVNNLYQPDGEPVTVEDIKTLNIDIDAVDMIVAAYIAALKQMNSKAEAEQKNESKASDS